MIIVSDEELHPPGTSPGWQESFYFNWSSTDGRFFGLTRIGLNPATGKADAVLVLLHDGEPALVYAAVGEPIPHGAHERRMSDGLTIGRLTYTLLDPLGSWRIELAGADRIDLTWTAFTPAVDFHHSFPGDELEMQRHFEQAGHVTGEATVRGRTAEVVGLGQRDKSWGVRDWAGIRGWEWIAGQFDDTLSFNATLTDIDGAQGPSGFVFDRGTTYGVLSVQVDYVGGHRPTAARITVGVEGGRTYVITGEERGRVPLYKQGLFIEETQFSFSCEVDGVRHEGAGVVEHAFHVGPLALLKRLPRLLKVMARARRDSR